ncbi:hypothetical protein [Nitrosophilus kaiyonis]|uniref:hypothetical protein n=1 Tax=Nitrosophilus kaiyonis TaxID=2930200 RepID=UPI0024918A21|nr:hypothetical protein [Nitrosophilus kaiyonis]
MKKIVEFFKTKNILFKKLDFFDLKEIGIKKRYKICTGVDIKNRYTIIFYIDRKSRLLQKDILSIIEILNKTILQNSHNYKNRFLITSAPICSKALKLLENENFKVYNASL